LKQVEVLPGVTLYRCTILRSALTSADGTNATT